MQEIVARQIKTESGSDYQKSNNYEQSDVKNSQREKIYDFIMDNYNQTDDTGKTINPRYLGLPGKSWQIENRLCNDFKNPKITALEKDNKIYTLNKHVMPRKQVYHPVIDIKEPIFKRFEIEYRVNPLCTYINGSIGVLTEDKTHSILVRLHVTFQYRHLPIYLLH